MMHKRHPLAKSSGVPTHVFLVRRAPSSLPPVAMPVGKKDALLIIVGRRTDMRTHVDRLWRRSVAASMIHEEQGVLMPRQMNQECAN